MTYEMERKIIISTCRVMQKLEYFLGTWGNISMRCGDNIILTPSRMDYNTMQPEDLVILDLDGKIIEGFRTPSSEKEVHRQIYKKRQDIKVIIHAHTSDAMAVSAMQNVEIPCMVEEMSQLLGGSIPVTEKYIPAQEHGALGIEAAENIGDKNGVILRNHGPVACGRTMEEAVLSVKVIEKACGIYLKLQGKKDIMEIPESYVQSERYRYLYQYGNENN